MKQLKKLHVQVLIGLACAVVLGLVAPAATISMKPLGQGFIALLKMMLAPIIFCTLVQGLAHVKDMGELGRLGLKSLVYFEVVSTVAMIIGFVFVNVFELGAGRNATNMGESGDALRATGGAGQISAVNYLLGLIPHTLVDAFAKGDIVQVLIISILAGLALNVSVGADSVSRPVTIAVLPPPNPRSAARRSAVTEGNRSSGLGSSARSSAVAALSGHSGRNHLMGGMSVDGGSSPVSAAKQTAARSTFILAALKCLWANLRSAASSRSSRSA